LARRTRTITFQRCFEYSFHSTIIDLGDDPIQPKKSEQATKRCSGGGGRIFRRYAVLFTQVVDRVLLLLVDPAAHGNEQETKTDRARHSRFNRIIGVLPISGHVHCFQRVRVSGQSEISRTSLIKPTTNPGNRRELGAVNWSDPAYANRHILARNDEEIISLSLEKPR
jgi:hypothetical protein